MNPIYANNGAVLAVVNSDGTVSVWSIPMDAAISIQPAKGLGAVTQIDESDSLAGAETSINSQLVSFRAV